MEDLVSSRILHPLTNKGDIFFQSDSYPIAFRGTKRIVGKMKS